MSNPTPCLPVGRRTEGNGIGSRWAFRHTLTSAPFVLTVVTLLVNDHVLKRVEWVPRLLTGKLSDFAGLLMVALLVSGATQSERRQRLRLGLLATVALAWVAWKSPVSDPLIRLVRTVLQPAGLSFGRTPDVTDLIALTMLPVATWLTARSVQQRRPSAPAIERASHRYRAVAMAFLALIATTATSMMREHPEYIVRSKVPAESELDPQAFASVMDKVARERKMTCVPDRCEDPRRAAAYANQRGDFLSYEIRGPNGISLQVVGGYGGLFNPFAASHEELQAELERDVERALVEQFGDLELAKQLSRGGR